MNSVSVLDCDKPPHIDGATLIAPSNTNITFQRTAQYSCSLNPDHNLTLICSRLGRWTPMSNNSSNCSGMSTKTSNKPVVQKKTHLKYFYWYRLVLERIADITQSLHYSDYIPTPTFMRTTLNCHPGFSNRHQFLKPGLKKVKTLCAWNRVALLSELDFPISPQQYQVMLKKAGDQLYQITCTLHS